MNYENRFFQRNPDFVARDIAGEYILVPIGQAAENFNGLASLNATSRFLWEYLAEKRSFEQVCNAFAKEYELTEELSRTDVTDFIGVALCRNLVLLY